MRKVTVFLCVDVSLEGLSAPYHDAIEKFSQLEPEILCLPWPDTAIPSIDSHVHSSNMPMGFEECVVSKHEYSFSSEEEKGIRVEVHLEPDRKSSVQTDQLLQYFAECGFVFYGSWDKPIKDILTEAGLYRPD